MLEHNYYDWEGVPCRVPVTGKAMRAAQMYQPGVGFVDGPALTIQFQARPIKKAEFDAMILAIIRAAPKGD